MGVAAAFAFLAKILITSGPASVILTEPLGDFLILLARPVEMVGEPSHAPDRLSGLLFPDGVL